MEISILFLPLAASIIAGFFLEDTLEIETLKLLPVF